MPLFEYQSQIPCAAQALYDYHAQPGCFDRLLPSWERVETLEVSGGIEDGAERLMRMHIGPFPFQWLARHEGNVPGAAFCDRMIEGPFRSWRHEHLFLPEGQASLLHDRVHWDLPLAGLCKATLDRRLKKVFAFRHDRTAKDLARQASYRDTEPMEVVLCGRQSRMSRHLAAFLSTAGHRVYRLTYVQGARPRFVFQDCFSGALCHPLDGADALIYTGRVPQPMVGAPEDPLAFWDFLDRVLRTAGQKPKLLLSLHPQNLPNQESLFDPSQPMGARLRSHRHNEQTTQMLETLADMIPRRVELYMATVIGENLIQWVDALLYLESFIFLAGGAATPTFNWIAHDDVLAAVLHVLASPAINGSYALAAPEQATRAEFQRLLLKRHLFRTSWLRMLRVQPWAKPGHPVGLRPELMDLPSLIETGFRPLAQELPMALD